MFAFVPIAGAMGYTLDAISDGFSGDPTLNSRSECKHVATGASLWTIRGKHIEPASAGDRNYASLSLSSIAQIMFAFVPIAGAMGYTLDAISDGFSGDPTETRVASVSM